MRTIKGRMIGGIAFVLVVVMLVIQVASLTVSYQTYDIRTKEYLDTEADIYRNKIDHWIDAQAIRIEDMKRTIEMLSYVDKKHINNLLEKNLEAMSDTVLDYYIGFEDKVTIRGGGEPPEGYDCTSRGWYKAAMAAGEMIYEQPYVDAFTQKIVISIAIPLEVGGKDAVLSSDIALDQVAAFVGEIMPTENSYGFLVASDGSFIIHPNETYLPNEEGVTYVKDVYPTLSENIEKSSFEIDTFRDLDDSNKYLICRKVDKMDWNLALAIETSIVNDSLFNTILLVSVITLIGVILVLIVLASLITKTLRPIQRLKQFISKVISSNGDLKFKNEIEEVNHITKLLEQQFVLTLQGTKNESINVNDAIHAIADGVEQLDEKVGNIYSGVKKIETNSQITMESMNIVNESLSSMECSVLEVSDRANEVAKSAGEIIERVSKSVPGMIESKNKAHEILNDVNQNMTLAIEQSKCIHEILDITKAITEIVNQTNLLSLNASIEAARAGESGRGFAIVAEQIKQLSENSQEETNKISSIVQIAIASVEHLVETGSKMIRFFDSQVVTDYEQFEELAKQYEMDAKFYSEVSEVLGGTSENLAESVNEIGDAIITVTKQSKLVYLETQEATGELEEVVNQTKAITSSVKNMKESSVNLKEIVGKFNI